MCKFSPTNQIYASYMNLIGVIRLNLVKTKKLEKFYIIGVMKLSQN